MQDQEKELFEGYEIKNWHFTPRLYKLFGAAAILNILLLFTVVQAEIFTTRGCDSPLVGNFCQVLDTIYLGSSLLDSDTDFVSKEYEKTEIEDADVTFIDVSGAAPPLNYPAGYFALANPESAMMNASLPGINGDFSMMPPPSFGGFPTNPTITNGNDLLSKPQITPPANPNVVSGSVADSPFDFEGAKTGVNPVPPIAGNRNGTARSPQPFIRPKRKTNEPKLPVNSETTAESKPNENQPPLNTDAVADFKPNKLPLEDFAKDILAKRADKAAPLDLTKAFKVKMVGELDKDGKLDPKRTRYTLFKPEEEGDLTMVNVAKSAIQAINDGNLFYYLKALGVDKVEMTLLQDDKQIYAVISSIQKTEDRAKTMSSGMIGLLALAKLKVEEKELKTLLDSAKSEQKGKNFVLNFKIDKPVAQEMITRKLQEAEAKAKKKEEEENGKPNSTATVNPNQKNAK